MDKLDTSAGNTARQDHLRRQLLRSSESIPPLPDVVNRLLALLDNPESTPTDLEQVLALEPVLVGKILSLVNSSLFSLSREFESVGEAVVMLGRSALRSMVLTHAAGPFMIADFSCYGHSEKGLWEHSIAVAAATRCLTHRCGIERDTREVMFVAGLLHDIGKMLIAPHLNIRRMSVLHFPGSTTHMERSTTGIDHTEAAGLVVSKWNMPETVQEVVSQHHGEQGPADYRFFAAVLRVAEAFCHEVGVGYVEGSAPEANYRPTDLAEIGDVGTGESWEQARQAMGEAVEEALMGFGRALG